MKKSLLLLALTLCFTSVVLSQGKNRISVFSGVLHNYADASKMINLEYTHHSFGVFHGILINSVGVEFKHYSANNLWWSASVQLLDESNGVRGDHFTNAIIFRSHLTSAITLGKTHSLTQRLSFDYGLGVLYKFSGDQIVKDSQQFFVDIEHSNMHCGGAILNGVLNYQAAKYLSFYTGLNARAYLLGVSENGAEFLPASRSVQDGLTLNFSLDLGMSFTF